MPLPTKVPATECPCITKEFLEEELRELGALRFSEEYGLEFVDPNSAAFPIFWLHSTAQAARWRRLHPSTEADLAIAVARHQSQTACV